MQQGFQFFPARGVKTLENGPDLMTGRRHYTKVVISLQPPIISVSIANTDVRFS